MFKEILLILLFTLTANSLQCYKCTTDLDQNSACEDLTKDQESVTTEECSAGHVCAVFTTKNPTLGTSKITRECAPRDVCEELHKDELVKIKDCRICNKDLCSSGTTNSFSMLFIALLLGYNFCI